MLVLGRRLGEEILINDDVKIVVVAIRGNQVRLGLTAPLDVRIQRSEIAVQADSPVEIETDAAWEPTAAGSH